MSSLIITKQTGNFFSLVLDGGSPIISEQNRLTTIGNFCNFKTANGANLILKQNILYSDITIVTGVSHVPTSINDLWISLLDAGFFDGLATTGGSSTIDRFAELLDTFSSYIGRDGQLLVVNESEQKIETIAISLFSEDDRAKLDGIETGAQVNVQSDVNETNPASPAYIKNFPDLGLGYTAEDVANKVSAITGYDTDLYPNEKATHDALDLKLNISDLPTNLTLYPTTTTSDVSGYVVMVKDIHDVRYNSTAVDVSTPTITGVGQLVSQRITDVGVLIGQPGVFNITTFGNIRRLSGSGTATFYFEVYHRDLAGVETLICTSSISNAVVNGTYAEFTASGVWDDGDFVATDRIVIKSYANRIAGGSDPVYQFQFGGASPVRTLLPVPFSVVDAGYELRANKQNDLTPDGTGTKYPTVDAVNAGFVNNSISNAFSMAAAGDNEFIIIGSVIARPSGTGVSSDPVNWAMISDADHDYSFITSLSTSVSGTLLCQYPKVKRIFNFTATGDEDFITAGTIFGSSVTNTQASISAYRPIMQGFRLLGNGTSTWTKGGTFAGNATVGAFDGAGQTIISPLVSTNPVEGTGVSIDYVGQNNYRVERTLSGGGTVFYLRDVSTNTRVTTPPTSTDAVIVSNYGVMSYRVNLDKWVTTPIGNLFMNTPTINVWIVGVFEVWLKVFSTSQTTQKAKWQSKSGVTTYKLYRDTASNLATKVLIYSGTDLQFIDTGLVANTMYYYELEDQTNTEISRFNSKTK